MLKDIVYIDIPIWKYIVKYLSIPSIIHMISSNPENYKITQHDYFWYYLGINYKSIFFWELASMRSEIEYLMLCDKSISRKQDFINVYNFDNHRNTTFLNELYYYLWIHLENGINKSNSYQMQNKLFQYYNLLNPLENKNYTTNYDETLFTIRQKIFENKFIK